MPWETLEQHAADLGIAFQLTNFIRDVAEDLGRGRIYLPQSSLDEFGVDRDRLQRGRVDEPIRNLLAWEIERARARYRAAAPGIALVDAASQECLRTAFSLYGEILDEIEQQRLRRVQPPPRSCQRAAPGRLWWRGVRARAPSCVPIRTHSARVIVTRAKPKKQVLHRRVGESAGRGCGCVVVAHHRQPGQQSVHDQLEATSTIP